jgi:hypothetical protein
MGVKLTVTEKPPVLATSPSTLSFTLSSGDKITSKSITIKNTGGAPLNWTATLDTHAPSFVSISSGAGTKLAAGASVNDDVIVNPSGVEAGPYTATVTIKAVDPLTGKVVSGSPASIAVTITITQPPSMQLSTQTLTFTLTPTPTNCVFTASGTVTITNTGGGTLGWDVADAVYTPGQPTGWLTVSPSGQGSNNATLKFSADGTGPKIKPGKTYTATVTITPSAGKAQAVTVSLSVWCPS